jgi:hypothetical protein
MNEINIDKDGNISKREIDPLLGIDFLLNEDCRPRGARNEVMRFEGFNISYNPEPCIGMGVMAGTSDETAIVVNPSGDTKFYILNGDFREDYKKLGPLGLKACLEFFAKNRAHLCGWGEVNIPSDI